jgi:hypothetical protein
MNPTILLILRAVGMLAGLQGKQKLGDSIALLADAGQAGQNVDAHMAMVATALEAGVEPDPVELRSRIEAESDRLQGT